MTRILISDANKASLVMSSEIFKDKIQGVSVAIAHTGKETVEKVKEEKFDLIMVDFDLPDCDGVSLTKLLRGYHQGPVFVTAFADDIVRQAMDEVMFGYEDARQWIPKPLRSEELAKRIEKFVQKKHAIKRRFFTLGLETKIIGKAEGRGKRAPKSEGILQNISFGGACICVDDPKVLKKSQELTLTIMVPEMEETKSKRKRFKAKEKYIEQTFKAKLAWKEEDRIGVEFKKLSEMQRKLLEDFLRKSM